VGVKYAWKYWFYGADPAIEYAFQLSQLLPDPKWELCGGMRKSLISGDGEKIAPGAGASLQLTIEAHAIATFRTPSSFC
jgi:hypothetical protein